MTVREALYKYLQERYDPNTIVTLKDIYQNLTYFWQQCPHIVDLKKEIRVNMLKLVHNGMLIRLDLKGSYKIVNVFH